MIRWFGEDALLWANRDTGFALYANARFGNHIRQVELACSGSMNRLVVGYQPSHTHKPIEAFHIEDVVMAGTTDYIPRGTPGVCTA